MYAVLEFSAYVQCHEEHLNDMGQCTMGGVCHGLTGNKQGGHWFIPLHCWTELPMPWEAIAWVSQISCQQGMLSTITYANQKFMTTWKKWMTMIPPPAVPHITQMKTLLTMTYLTHEVNLSHTHLLQMSTMHHPPIQHIPPPPMVMMMTTLILMLILMIWIPCLLQLIINPLLWVMKMILMCLLQGVKFVHRHQEATKVQTEILGTMATMQLLRQSFLVVAYVVFGLVALVAFERDCGNNNGGLLLGMNTHRTRSSCRMVVEGFSVGCPVQTRSRRIKRQQDDSWLSSVWHGQDVSTWSKNINNNNNNRSRKYMSTTKSVLMAVASVQVDYEYIPSDDEDNNNNNDIPNNNNWSKLWSSYPVDTPAGLRGEAVRSALRSGQCIGWSSSSSSSNPSSSSNSWFFGGVVQMQGPGCLDVLNNQLSQNFLESSSSITTTTPKTLSSSASIPYYYGSVQQAALLTSKGRMVDRLVVATTTSTTTTNESLLDANHGNNQVEDEEEGRQRRLRQRPDLAYLLTSPGGHAPLELAQRLDRYIFPLDQVTVQIPTNQCHFVLASYSMDHVNRVFASEIWPRLLLLMTTTTTTTQTVESSSKATTTTSPRLPQPDQCLILPLSNHHDNDTDMTTTAGHLIVLPTISLPAIAAVGCTFVFVSTTTSSSVEATAQEDEGEDTNTATIGQSLWSYLVSKQCVKGPVELGALEWESLRIEAGQPRFGCEYTGHWEAPLTKNKKTIDETPETSSLSSSSVAAATKPAAAAATVAASPLELWDSSLVAMDKGCFMGQEGIASMVKNPRGPPRSLYQVVFDDDVNLYESQTRKTDNMGGLKNRTQRPQPGQILCVLGSNESIVVGTITSVAEPGSTGDFGETLALVLVKRASSIVSQMKGQGLDLPDQSNDLIVGIGDRSRNNNKNGVMGEDASASGLILPPPLDPLDGVEVIVQGGFAMGILRSIPSRRPGQYVRRDNMFLLLNDDDDGGGGDDATSWNDGNVAAMATANPDRMVDVTRVPLTSGTSKPETATRADGTDSFGGTDPSVGQSPLGEDVVMEPWDAFAAASAQPGVRTVEDDKEEGTSDDDNNLDVDDDDKDDEEDDDEDEQKLAKELERAEKEAKAAAAEAKRKADKMALLQQRAEQALAARKLKKQKQQQQQQQQQQQPNEEQEDDDNSNN